MHIAVKHKLSFLLFYTQCKQSCFIPPKVKTSACYVTLFYLKKFLLSMISPNIYSF